MREILLLVALFGLASGQSDVLVRAQEQYRRTDYRQALETLKPALANDAAAIFLAGKSWFMLGEFKKASELFHNAAVAQPAKSEYHHWLGKAYGRRAETANFFTAPRYASQCRQAFERAVALNPQNVEAMSDLLEYYMEAPGIMGGGLDKAEALAVRMAAKDPAESQYSLARIAEKRKDFQKAEQHLRRASEMAPQHVGLVVDLAKFLARHGKVSESEAAFQRAAALAPNNPKLLYERAQFYIESKRNLPRAKALLERYLKSDLTPDDPPRENAERLLRQASGS